MSMIREREETEPETTDPTPVAYGLMTVDLLEGATVPEIGETVWLTIWGATSTVSAQVMATYDSPAEPHIQVYIHDMFLDAVETTEEFIGEDE